MHKRFLAWILSLTLAAALGALGWIGFTYYRTNYVNIDGIAYRKDTGQVDLSGMPIEEFSRLALFDDPVSMDLRGTGLTAQQYDQLRGWFPDCRISWDVLFHRTYVPSDITTLTITELDAEDLSMIPYFPKLSHVNARQCRDYPQLVALKDAYPGLRVFYNVSVQGQDRPGTTQCLDLTDADGEELLAALPYLPGLQKIFLRGKLPEIELLEQISRDYPEIHLGWTVEIGGKTFPAGLDSLDISGQVPDRVEDLAEMIRYFPHLASLRLGQTSLDNQALLELDRQLEALRIIWDIPIGSKVFSTDCESLDLSRMYLGDPAVIENLLPYFPDLKRVDMSYCGISNAAMDELNRRHEDVRFVWTVDLGGAQVRTDATYFMPYQYHIQVEDPDIYNLRYCTDMLCVDLGHMDVTNCDFAAFMPKLKYLLLADTKITSIKPLEGLQELLYLEIFLTGVQDYTPLLSCPKLEDLNLCWTYGDPNVIAKMPQLKRLWWSGKWHPQSVRDMLHAAIPGAIMEFDDGWSTGSGWREGQNYKDMRDLLGMYYME